MLEERIKCLNQGSSPINKEGTGHCPTCTYDPINNPNCTSYTPIKLRIFNVTRKDFVTRTYLDSQYTD